MFGAEEVGRYRSWRPLYGVLSIWDLTSCEHWEATEELDKVRQDDGEIYIFVLYSIIVTAPRVMKNKSDSKKVPQEWRIYFPFQPH